MLILSQEKVASENYHEDEADGRWYDIPVFCPGFYERTSEIREISVCPCFLPAGCESVVAMMKWISGGRIEVEF